MVEGLEGRLVLSTTLGAHFPYGSRITYSFVPDGASIGGSPSVLYQTLNGRFATATWQQQFQKAAAVWQAVANINFVQVGDDGSPLGVDGNQQGDTRFGDIRISAVPQASGSLAVCFLPPPINGGTDAGDIILNSNAYWQINSSYDLQTVAIHEFGHALGLGHSVILSACMYAYYNGVKQSLTADDTTGIQSVWQAPQPDQFNSNGLWNGTYSYAANITSYIDSNGQIELPNLRLTSASQSEWFLVTVPATSSGSMVVTVQAANLSMLSPKLGIYTSSLGFLGSLTSSGYGGTLTARVIGVQPGQSYYIRTNGNATYSASGGYGLQLNFGSGVQPPIAPPNTVAASQPDQGGGAYGMEVVALGSHQGLGETLRISDLLFDRPSPRALAACSPRYAASTGTAPGQGTLDTVFDNINQSRYITVITSDARASQTPLTPVAAPGVVGVVDTVLSDWKPQEQRGGFLDWDD